MCKQKSKFITKLNYNNRVNRYLINILNIIISLIKISKNYLLTI